MKFTIIGRPNDKQIREIASDICQEGFASVTDAEEAGWRVSSDVETRARIEDEIDRMIREDAKVEDLADLDGSGSR